MAYKRFARPASSEGWSCASWEQWVLEQELLINVWPDQPNVCGVCWGAVGISRSGTPFATCYNCSRQAYLAGLVPVSYSWEGGLEGMLARAKSSVDGRWLNLPLAAVLERFLDRHLLCIEKRFGPVDLITLLPSNPRSRNGWDHLRCMYESVTSWPGHWDIGLLTKPDSVAACAARGTLTTRFEMRRQISLRGKRVLLVDDTWTSGGTMLSAAKAVFDVTGIPAVAVTLGRQVYTKDPENYLIGDINRMMKPYDVSLCAVHQ